jgi:carboxymethylenebutenolidase
VVLAPNTLYRAGRAPVFPLPDLKDADNRAAFIAQVRPLIGGLTADVVATDGDAYLGALSERAAPGPVAITGYCMGGRVGWHIARSHPGRVAALASFHGGNLAVADDPESPHRSVGAFDAELYFAHADQDHSMTAEQIELLERALAETDLTYRSELYDGAAHGWTMSDTAVYDEAATERHFEELFALLDRTIAAPAG